ncbi:MAG: hypothetical protein JWM33_2398 [Caulobacteraceae bacterium]|nr:hypothetical protein [Caulobacteraceae bacterium]
MANTLLSATAVTREALRVLHQKLNFVGSITREYDSSFAKDGAKIGDTLKIRLPNEYVVRSGAALAAQDTVETSIDLKVQTQKGVDLNFTSADLTLNLDNFSDRIIEPAMARLAANIEADAMSMYKDVYQQVNNHGAAVTLAKVFDGRKMLVDSLAPPSGRVANLNSQDNVDLINDVKGLFNAQETISKQYREGYVGRTAGFDFMENTLWPSHTPGTKAGTPLVNGATQTGAALITDGWTASTAALKRGDVFTVAGVFKVHPETKASTGILQQFVATADGTADGSGNLTVAISPTIVTSGASQNVSGSPADNVAITVAGTGSTAHGVSMAYQKSAFAFATADLVLPKGVDWGAREVFDGVSMRIVRQYDINADKLPCRLDVLYGYKTIRPQLAVRLANR